MNYCFIITVVKKRLRKRMKSKKSYYNIIIKQMNNKWQPKIGERFYYPNFIYSDLYNSTLFDTDTQYKRLLFERGLCFKTKEEAVKCANEMLNQLNKYHA